jgi:ABC-type multidrug transport system ATPase subunit
MDSNYISPVSVEVHDVSVSVREKKFSWRKRREVSYKPILSEVSLNVRSGSLTAIMGPSGSGKVGR